MKNAKINMAFLKAIDADTREAIIRNIARHYGITKEMVLLELSDEEAEPLLDYLTGPVRTATSALMQRMWRGPGKLGVDRGCGSE